MESVKTRRFRNRTLILEKQSRQLHTVLGHLFLNSSRTRNDNVSQYHLIGGTLRRACAVPTTISFVVFTAITTPPTIILAAKSCCAGDICGTWCISFTSLSSDGCLRLEMEHFAIGELVLPCLRFPCLFLFLSSINFQFYRRDVVC